MHADYQCLLYQQTSPNNGGLYISCGASSIACVNECHPTGPQTSQLFIYAVDTSAYKAASFFPIHFLHIVFFILSHLSLKNILLFPMLPPFFLNGHTGLQITELRKEKCNPPILPSVRIPIIPRFKNIF